MRSAKRPRSSVNILAMPSHPIAAHFSPLELAAFVPKVVGKITDHQKDLPRIARDPKLTAAIETALREIPTTHDLYCHDSRALDFISSESVHLVVTSPPYWTLK